ncbi:uncharacterized protein LOC124353077 [Homalodisca vitripennis]|uniref:uncharacterized protein LOC124353077 n=1 Tax=Homalodisca vitripennis TaxID=197043 RepID=UPI001EEA6255|nr:uncharacterized protein LOC124353077 [Homalodisca vitripennis]
MNEDYEAGVIVLQPKITPKDNCVVCGAGTFMGCADCFTLYCSVNCQAKDWPSHSRTCKTSSRSNSGSRTDLCGAGDNRKMRQDVTNGFRSAANRFDDRPQSNDKLQNRFTDRCIDQFAEANQDERSHNSSRKNNQSNSDPPRNLFEERRSRYNTNKANNNDSGRGGGQKQRGGAQRNQYERRNIKDTNLNSKTDADDEKWDTQVKETNAATNFEKPTTGIDFIQKEKAFLQTASEITTKQLAVGNTPVTSSTTPKTKATTAVTAPLTVGKKEVVVIIYKEPTMKYIFYVQRTKSASQFNMLTSKLESISNWSPISGSPALGDLCVAEFDYAWSRVQVICLNPLTVKYIDFGNSEITTADKLFTIPTELKDIPPFLIKIKLADETPKNYLETELGESLTIEPIEQVDDYWIVKVDGVHLPTNGTRSNPVTPTLAPTHATAQVSNTTASIS